MQKFSEFVKEHKSILETKTREEATATFNTLYEAKLKEFGAKSLMDLDEDQLETFNAYVKSLKEDLTKGAKKADISEDADKPKKKSSNDEVTDEKSFREYAEGVLKKAHGDDYDEKIANKVIDGLIDKVGKDGDWGQAIGRLTSGLGG